MRIFVNDSAEEYEDPEMTVRDLLRKKRYSFPLIIIKVGGVLVERAEYDTTQIHDGDVVDLYHLVSGG